MEELLRDNENPSLHIAFSTEHMTKGTPTRKLPWSRITPEDTVHSLDKLIEKFVHLSLPLPIEKLVHLFQLEAKETPL